MNIPALRLAGQALSAGKFATAVEVVRHLGAVQAQDYGQAVWAVGSRTNRPSLAEVEAAVARGEIIRTWPMRGTLHFVAAEDVRWMLQLSPARMLAGDGRRRELLGLDERTLNRSQTLLSEALGSGKSLTRPEVMALFETDGIATGGGRGYHLLWRAAQSGLICRGPLAGRQQTFRWLSDWAPAARELPRDAALAELARRYFTSRGPATLADFTWWSGLTAADARAGLEAVKPDLVSQTHDGTAYWLAPDIAPVPTDQVLLLAGFDEYVLGYKDRSTVLKPGYMAKITPGSNGIFQPVVVVDGQVVGIWKRQVKPAGVTVTVDRFEELGPAAQTSLAAAIRHYQGFYEVPKR